MIYLVFNEGYSSPESERASLCDPSAVVTLNRAVAVSKVRRAQDALDLVEPLAEALSGYFYFHGLRGALLQQLGRQQEARQALSRAIGLAATAAEAAHIREHLDQLEVGSQSCSLPKS